MSDPILYMTEDGGELRFTEGGFPLSSGLESAAVISLFGGNSADSGVSATASQTWWGNLEESREERKIYGRLGAFISGGAPATSTTVREAKEVAGEDLAWLLDGYATALSVETELPSYRRLNVLVSIETDGDVVPVDTFGVWA